MLRRPNPYVLSLGIAFTWTGAVSGIWVMMAGGLLLIAAAWRT